MMDLEAKAKLGKEVMVGLTQGVAFEIVMSHIVLTCMKAGETELDKLVDEILVLGLNEYAIDAMTENYIASAEHSLKANAGGGTVNDMYNKISGDIRKICESDGNKDAIDMIIPLRTLTGMALCKAGEKLMRGDVE